MSYGLYLFLPPKNGASIPVKILLRSSGCSFDSYLGNGSGFFKENKEPYHTEPVRIMEAENFTSEARMVLHSYLH